MKTQKFPGAETYIAPRVEVADISAEGVLCLSARTEDYEYNEVEW